MTTGLSLLNNLGSLTLGKLNILKIQRKTDMLFCFSFISILHFFTLQTFNSFAKQFLQCNEWLLTSLQADAEPWARKHGRISLCAGCHHRSCEQRSTSKLWASKFSICGQTIDWHLTLFLLYLQCPSGTDQLLNYFNNNNGGLFQNVLPSVTNEVGSLFPGLSALPQVAASTFGDLASSSSNNVASSSTPGTGIGFVDGFVDTLAGMIAGATGKKWLYLCFFKVHIMCPELF